MSGPNLKDIKMHATVLKLFKVSLVNEKTINFIVSLILKHSDGSIVIQ